MPSPRRSVPDRIIAATLELCAETGHPPHLAEIAARASISITTLRRHFPSREAILGGFFDQIEQNAFKAPRSPDFASYPPRERLFDSIMRWLDALQPHRAALIPILDAKLKNRLIPPGAIALRPVQHMLGGLLEASLLSSAGLRGEIRRFGLSLVIFSALQSWSKDQDSDLAITMATVDRNLTRVDRLVAGVQNAIDCKSFPCPPCPNPMIILRCLTSLIPRSQADNSTS